MSIFVSCNEDFDAEPSPDSDDELSSVEEPRFNHARRPGWGLAIEHRAADMFPTALFDTREAPLLTVREYTMMELMNRITDKPNWDAKVFDDGTVSKWKAEAMNVSDEDVTEKMVDWCIAELRYKATKFKRLNCVETLDGVWKSDTIVSDGLKDALKRAAVPLEDVPENNKDWHPGSNEKVLDLVHPSVYPLVYGQTRVICDGLVGLEDCLHRSGEIELEREDEVSDHRWSSKYQWLPADFLIPRDSDDVKIVSYINNLHPERHGDLYRIVEKVVAKAIMLWDQTLTHIMLQPPLPRVEMDYDGYESSIPPERSEGEDHEAYQARWKALRKFTYGEPDWDDFDDKDEFEDAYQAWKRRRTMKLPEPREFQTPQQRLWSKKNRERPGIPKESPDYYADEETMDLRSDFGKLQIIVKLTTIHLTIEKPYYGGGSWHVEGQANEAICATALYYFDSSNISESLLAFRQKVEIGIDLNYEQDDHRAVETMYGFQNEEPAIQELGEVVTREGRLLTFPNSMQHRVHPFHLEDPTKPGHRRILALFLVDPHQTIISTANVPCQQKAWWEEQVRNIGPLGNIPPEITDYILELIDYPVSLEVTKAQRLELMEERKDFVKAHQEDFETRASFSLCEH